MHIRNVAARPRIVGLFVGLVSVAPSGLFLAGAAFASGSTVLPVSSATTPAWAYGVQYPGQVVAFGAAQVLGVGAQQVCADCGRQLRVVYDV